MKIKDTMESIKKVLLVTLCAYNVSTGMEQPLQPLPHNLASFSGLPAELKEYLLPFVVSGTLKDMTRGLYNLAALDKKHHAWINDSNRVTALLEKLPRICNGISLICKLKDKKYSLPVMASGSVQNWRCTAKKIPLPNEKELEDAVAHDNQPLVSELLKKRNICLHRISNIYGRPALEWAVRNGNTAIAGLLINAGIDCDDNGHILRTAFWIKANKNIIQLLYDAGARLSMMDGETMRAFTNALETSRGELFEFLIEFRERWLYKEFAPTWADKSEFQKRLKENSDELKMRLLAGGRVMV